MNKYKNWVVHKKNEIAKLGNEIVNEQNKKRSVET